ncbi:hypothetical protein BVE86_03095 [Streptococcus azizii]|uniref:Uncharacterized protein n=1 Tax=Streptococcus azizii TaxID=1579424 RepID=A0AB36JN87_9STRE|nr:hypothetical protein BVE86_03095 [Streptococcus azizii]
MAQTSVVTFVFLGDQFQQFTELLKSPDYFYPKGILICNQLKLKQLPIFFAQSLGRVQLRCEAVKKPNEK